MSLSICPTCDVALGRADFPGSDYPDALRLAAAQLGKGSALLGIGYPDSQVRASLAGIHVRALLRGENRGLAERSRPLERAEVGWLRHSVTTPPGFSGGLPIRKRTGLVHGLMAGGFSSFSGPSVALGVGAFVNDWEVSTLGDLTLLEYADKNPGKIVVR